MRWRSGCVDMNVFIWMQETVATVLLGSSRSANFLTWNNFQILVYCVDHVIWNVEIGVEYQMIFVVVFFFMMLWNAFWCIFQDLEKVGWFHYKTCPAIRRPFRSSRKQKKGKSIFDMKIRQPAEVFLGDTTKMCIFYDIDCFEVTGPDQL